MKNFVLATWIWLAGRGGAPLAIAALLIGFSPAIATSQTSAFQDPPQLKDQLKNLATSLNAPENHGLREWLRVGAIASGILAGSGVIVLVLERSRRRFAWERADLARRTVEEFCEKESVRYILQILNFEEYRDLQIQIPYLNRSQINSPTSNNTITLTFEATDERLRRSLRRHGEIVKLKQGFNQILAAKSPPREELGFDLEEAIAEFQREFHIELTLRDWFDDFLTGLNHFNAMIESQLVSAKDFEPYIKHWIQLIADRNYRRQGGSNFYDQLFLYIHHSMYTGVQTLFKRYGFTIISPPYEPTDFIKFLDRKISREYNTEIAIALGKAAYLSYEHEDYIKGIVQRWTVGDAFPNYRGFANEADFVYKVMAYCNDVSLQARRDSATQFRFFDGLSRGSDTQAYVFRISHLIILVFRGTQQPQDWLTNANFIQANLDSQTEVSPRLKGQVHNGFQTAWKSIRHDVLHTLQKWQQPGDEIWVTGHSLGGALATLAATTLAEEKLPITRLYTFGQPRTGNGFFIEYFNTELQFKELGQRFVNNTDIVPRVPLRGLSWRFWLAPWNWRSLYAHGGNLRYFNFRGRLWLESRFPARLCDGIIGSIVGLWIPGWEFITNHSMELYLLNLQKTYLKEQEETERLLQEKQTEMTMKNH